MRIVVLGAGVAGATAAYQLLRDGHQVTVIDRQPIAANEASYGNAGMLAPGHSYTWASPKAPGILMRSLFQRDQALRLTLRADPKMWAWCLQFLWNCTADRAKTNTLRETERMLAERRVREIHLSAEEALAVGIVHEVREFTLPAGAMLIDV